MTINRENWVVIFMCSFAALAISAAVVESYQIWFS